MGEREREKDRFMGYARGGRTWKRKRKNKEFAFVEDNLFRHLCLRRAIRQRKHDNSDDAFDEHNNSSPMGPSPGIHMYAD